MTLSIGDRRLGSVLLEQGFITDTDLDRALERQSEVGGRLADILIDSGMVGEKRIAGTIEEKLGIQLVHLPQTVPSSEAIAAISGDMAQGLQAIPFKLEGDTLHVAFVDALNTVSQEAVEDESGYMVEPYQVLREQFQWALASFYPELGLPVPELRTEEAVIAESPNLLGQRLISQGLIQPQQLDAALEQQRSQGGLLGTILVSQRTITEAQLFETLAQQFNTRYVADTRDYTPNEDLLNRLIRSEALKLSAVPIAEQGGVVQVITSDPRKRADIEDAVGHEVELLLARPGDIDGLIERVYPQKGRVGELLVTQEVITRDELRQAIRVQLREGKKRLLGEVIAELGFATNEEIENILQQNQAVIPGSKLEDTLVQSGKLSPEMLARSLASQLGYEYLDPHTNAPDPKVALLVPEATARRYAVIPMRLQGNQLVVAMKDPRNVFALDDLKLMTGRDILPAVMTEKDIIRLIERYFGDKDMAALNDELTKTSRAKEQEATENLELSALDDNAIVRVVDSIIREAALQEVSDIHIEPTEHNIKVRFRIDGTLRDHMELPRGAGQSMLARIKIMGKLDIAERRLPQDGRIRFKRGSVDIDLRLSTLPTVYGEKAVMRLLQKASNIPEVEQLGFSEYNYKRYTEVIEKPNGIFLVTGPTGSGKSFTSFSTLKRIASPEKNTTTIEDPIEYEIPGIVQSQVNNAAGMTFARALRAFLRQDPDIIFVGEIRDQETAGIAVEAALTGHLVLATLHTNDAPGAIVRLEEMGLEAFNIAAAVVGVLAQRLVRRVCKDCKQPTTADPDVLRRLGLTDADIEGATLMRGAGCPRCNGTGYRGRMGIHELMVIDEPLRRAISAGKSVTEVKDIAISQSGMTTLRDDGIQKALQGFTTLEAVLAVTSS